MAACINADTGVGPSQSSKCKISISLRYTYFTCQIKRAFDYTFSHI